MTKIVSLEWEKALENIHDRYYSVFAIVDKRVADLYDINIDNQFLFEVEETNKTLEKAIPVWDWLSNMSADRRSVLVVIGGGMLTDLGGFIAATYMRGIDAIYFPTTLLGMVDAAIGGKTGINFQHFKNRIGTFQLPKEVIIDPSFLNTLEKAQLLSGFAELIKTAFIADVNLSRKVFAIKDITQLKALPQVLIQAASKVKQDMVGRDFYEEGERKKLNAGHTFGHAIESFFMDKKVTVPHGIAVAAGLWMELSLSKISLDKPDLGEIQSMQSFLQHWYDKLPLEKQDFESIYAWMQGDKKNDSGKTNFTLIEKVGKSHINIYPTRNKIESAFNSYINEYEFDTFVE